MPVGNAWHKGAPKGSKHTATKGASNLDGGNETTQRHRLSFTLLALVGSLVRVETISKRTYEGVLVGAAAPNPVFEGCSLRFVRQVAPNNQDGMKEKMNIPWSETVFIHAVDAGNMIQQIQMDLSGGTAPQNVGMKLDTEISAKAGPPGASRKLESVDSSWISDGKGASVGSLGGKGGKWDQFKANKELFGVVSTYDENLYTTELDKNELSSADKKRADELARSIEGKGSSNIHVREERGQVLESDMNADEEAKYSSVSRTKEDSYQPPHKRTQSPPKPEDTPVVAPDVKEPSGSSWASLFKEESATAPPPPPTTTTTTNSATNSTSAVPASKTGAVTDASEAPLNESVQRRQREVDDLKKFSKDITDKIASKVSSPQSSGGKEFSEKQKFKINPNAKEWTPNAKAKSFVPAGAGQGLPTTMIPPGANMMMPQMQQQLYMQPDFVPYPPGVMIPMNPAGMYGMYPQQPYGGMQPQPMPNGYVQQPSPHPMMQQQQQQPVQAPMSSQNGSTEN